MLKEVYVKQDESGHWYVIPTELNDEFNRLYNDYFFDEENQSLADEFEEKYAKYRTGGDINNVQLFADIE